MDLIFITAQMENAAKKAGDLILSIPRPEITSKEGHANFVTTADGAAQNLLVSLLTPLIPDAHFFAEEEEDHTLKSGYPWIIDPIDGTTNFIRGTAASVISIALWFEGEIVAGVVYDPYRKELFSASKGNGAFLNGSPIHTIHRPVEESIIYFGTSPYYRHLLPTTMRTAEALFTAGGDLRRSGSAAMELCYLACGRYDAYFEATLSPWDYAAGTVILKEAGGIIASLPAERFTFEHRIPVFAADSAVYEPLYRAAMSVFDDSADSL